MTAVSDANLVGEYSVLAAGCHVRKKLPKSGLWFGKGRAPQADRIVHLRTPLVDTLSQQQCRAKRLRQGAD